RPAGLNALGRVARGLLERGLGDAEGLEPDGDPRLGHEREDILSSTAGVAEELGARVLKDQRAGRRSADRELVLGALDDVVAASPVNDEQAEAAEPLRARDHA